MHTQPDQLLHLHGGCGLRGSGGNVTVTACAKVVQSRTQGEHSGLERTANKLASAAAAVACAAACAGAGAGAAAAAAGDGWLLAWIFA
eukprot:1145264-Pelagomonas_calceolata.AAC.5